MPGFSCAASGIETGGAPDFCREISPILARRRTHEGAAGVQAHEEQGLYQARRTGGILCRETYNLLRLLYGKGARNQAGRGPQMDLWADFSPMW